MTRTIKLLSIGLVATAGLAVLGAATWEWQKGLHYYSWQLLPIDERSGQIKCVGMFGLSWYLWLADTWRCEAIDPIEDTNRFPDVLNNPDCDMTRDLFVRCDNPNKILQYIMEYEGQ